VGDSHASPTAALLLTVLQESMGRIATILFAHRLGTSLEPECKMYRLAADIFNDAAMLLDCLSPALPKASRVALLSVSSVLRSLCGVAAGSSKASLSAHFATQGNLGELNAVSPFSAMCGLEGVNISKERLEPRNNHLPDGHVGRKSCSLIHLNKVGNVDSNGLPSRYPPRDQLPCRQSCLHANAQ